MKPQGPPTGLTALGPFAQAALVSLPSLEHAERLSLQGLHAPHLGGCMPASSLLQVFAQAHLLRKASANPLKTAPCPQHSFPALSFSSRAHQSAVCRLPLRTRPWVPRGRGVLPVLFVAVPQCPLL